LSKSLSNLSLKTELLANMTDMIEKHNLNIQEGIVSAHNQREKIISQNSTMINLLTTLVESKNDTIINKINKRTLTTVGKDLVNNYIDDEFENENHNNHIYNDNNNNDSNAEFTTATSFQPLPRQPPPPLLPPSLPPQQKSSSNPLRQNKDLSCGTTKSQNEIVSSLISSNQKLPDLKSFKKKFRTEFKNLIPSASQLLTMNEIKNRHNSEVKKLDGKIFII